jgi:hypothetical protein
VLVLSWGNNQKDLEVVWKVLSQMVLAHRNDGGVTVVVLTQREKLEMEDYFRRVIPFEKRFGTKFVFRQVCARRRRSHRGDEGPVHGCLVWPKCRVLRSR